MEFKLDEVKVKVERMIVDEPKVHESSKPEAMIVEDTKCEASKTNDTTIQNSEVQLKDETQLSVPSSSTSSDTKSVSDPKASNVKIVRGTKRIRIDPADANPTDKKGISLQLNSNKT